MAENVDLTLVTLRLEALDEAAAARLLGVLSKYVVLARGHEGCRNIDLVASMTTPGRFLVIQKWASPEAQQVHFDSAEMVEMAGGCRGLLASAPSVDLWEGLSAHDLA